MHKRITFQRTLIYEGFCADGEDVKGYRHSDGTYTLVFSSCNQHLATLFVKSHNGFSKITEEISKGVTRGHGVFGRLTLL